MAYMAGFSKECETIASRIRSLLSLSPSSSDIVMDSTLASLDQGRMLDAIRLVRLHKGLSLTEATRFVQQLQRPPHPASAPHR